jgi:choline-glycine betaine transporter
MGFELGPKQKMTDLLLTPGPILTILGVLVLVVSVFFFNQAAPSGSDVDAIIEARSHSGSSLKSMLGMVCGVVMCLVGALLSLMTLNRRG